jgi:UrcA family protein
MAYVIKRAGSSVSAAAVCVFGLLSQQPALAQPVAAADQAAAIEEITVVAPELVRQEAGRGRHGQRIEVVSLTKKVSYADLDLTKPSDQTELRNRIRTTATAACKELDARTKPNLLYAPPGEHVCLSDATAESMKLANQVIAAANAR